MEPLDAAGSLFQCQVSAADEVVVADGRAGAFGEHRRRGNGELDVQSRIAVEGNLFDLAHLDTGDADEIAATQTGDVGKVRVVDRLVLEAKLAEDENHKRYRQQAHHRVDGETPQRAAQIFSHVSLSLWLPAVSGQVGQPARSPGATAGGGGGERWATVWVAPAPDGPPRFVRIRAAVDRARAVAQVWRWWQTGIQRRAVRQIPRRSLGWRARVPEPDPAPAPR